MKLQLLEEIIIHLELLGKRVKEARLTKSYTQQDLAALCNLTKSHISKIENGQTSPAIATLSKIAQVLDAPLSWFLESNSEAQLSIVKKSSRSLKMGNAEIGYMYEALANRPHFSKIEPVIITVLPEAEHVEPFTHLEDEFIYVLSGSIKLSYGGQLHILAEGDSAYLDGSIPHIFLNDEEGEAKVLSIFI
ncbi:HTH-type transcriptional regulator PuuR [Planococcus massiliensis]|uniref:HTH-type transcriptional regulator PuuR n=1 Tax=Planococcus massiliensis TaxID=1499687 RepID=A0A098EQ24_9BACL|nr:XRE family transcriptional regulator [Planococcus massiliensis]CEG23900.1 HTH-type transcriptional regulator PuuR [Planococcus massiliensis]